MAASDSSKRDKFFTVRNVLFVGAGNKRVRRFVVSSYCHALSEFFLSHHDVHAEPAGSDPLRITLRHSLRRHIHSRWGRADGGPTDTADLCSRCVVSGPANDDSPTFSPDGNTTFFTRSTGNWGAIVESHLVNGHWTQPALAPFSSEWPDASPAMSPDGSYLYLNRTGRRSRWPLFPKEEKSSLASPPIFGVWIAWAPAGASPHACPMRSTLLAN
jgi:hypothetical protein